MKFKNKIFKLIIKKKESNKNFDSITGSSIMTALILSLGNASIRQTIMDDNQQFTSIGAYDILTAVNTDKSKVELLSFRVMIKIF